MRKEGLLFIMILRLGGVVMLKNLVIKKSLVVGTMSLSILGSKYRVVKDPEVIRVKGYLEDFLTEDNYVDLSKISTSYDIKNFSGEDLAKALSDSDIKYVRITDDYIYDGKHVEPFLQKTAMNYKHILGIDDNFKIVYEGYEPIRNVVDGSLVYEIPKGYKLTDIEVIAEPVRYDELASKEIVVTENDYEDSYSLSLKRK